MKVALATFVQTPHPHENLATILARIREAALEGAGMVVFPELALTGFRLTDVHAEDEKNAQSLSSREILSIGEACRQNRVWAAFGFLEICGGTLFDSALVLNDEGNVALHYRRNSPGWRHPKAHPGEYGCGQEIPICLTPIGKTMVLICGDLYDAAVLERAAVRCPDVLLHLDARSFPVADAEAQWEGEEIPENCSRYAKVAKRAFLVNACHPDSEAWNYPGGAFAWKEGRVVARQPLRDTTLLLVDA